MKEHELNQRPNDQQQVKILVADDHRMFSDGVISLLSEVPGIQMLGAEANGQELLDRLETTAVDLVLMDVNMPEKDGLEATRELKQRYPTVKVLMLTMMNDPKLVTKLIESGADGYILKNTGKDELLRAIQSIQEGQSYYSPEVTATVMESFRKKKAPKSARALDAKVELTKRELEVLKLIAEEFTAVEIAEKLFISQNTVDSHRKNLLSKLDARNTAGLVKYAVVNGLS